MPTPSTCTVLVIGGTGAQGIPVVRHLVADGKYAVRVLTLDSSSPRARDLARLGNVSFVDGTFADDDVLHEALAGCTGAFVDIDGFNTGEKTEMYWAMRTYEIAIEEGLTFFVYANLDYGLKKAGYDSTYRTRHYDGKGRITEWILGQNDANRERMGAAVFTSGPYIEMTISPGTPMTPSIEDGTVVWRVPLGDGFVPHVALDDSGYYVRWLFDHPRLASGLNLEVAIADITYTELAAAFEKVTGNPARFVDIGLDEYWNGPLSRVADSPAGYNADPGDRGTMSFSDYFTGFWNLWKNGIVTRDYALLDEIHPGRIRSAEEWFREGRRGGTCRRQRNAARTCTTRQLEHRIRNNQEQR
ncbi:hypothetical protein QE397_003317 [Rhodococcus sp. SORGH_AS 301]|nr:hypothetical protein [Rhodococcus sp. SORGH_AS_0301]